MWDCVDQVHIHLCGGVRPGEDKIRGLGPAVAFGQEMHRLTGIPQGLIASGHGGTSMAQWDPARKKEGGKSLYGAMIRRLTKNGGRAAGMIWYQGESDANPDCAKVYTERMKTLIRSVRRDTRSPKLPFALVQISRLVATWGSPGAWNSVQDQERRLQETVPAVVTVPAIDLTLEDLIHVGGPDVNRLGRRLGQAMAALLGVKGQKLPPALKSVSAKVSPLSGAVDLTVEYDNVQGALRAGSRPCGFDLVDANGTPYVYDILLEGNRAILRTSCALASLSDKALYYGYGYNPVCNITDEADRCLPVMGPISPSEHKRAIVPFVRKPQVSDLLPSAGRLGGLAYPNTSSLAWQTREFPTHFCNRHEELGKLAPEDRLVYYRCRIDVPDDMRLAVLLGYDGPVKLWVDGKELYHDPNGTNPAIEDQRSIPFSAKKGQHEVLVALASNNGKAWGVFLRFERLGVPKRLLEKGPESYAMPVVLGQ
jgi:sialate O-acetylesterase